MLLIIMEQLQVHAQSELGSIMQRKYINHTNRKLNVPRTVACRVLSSDMLKALSDIISYDDIKQLNGIEVTLADPFLQGLEAAVMKPPSCNHLSMKSSLVLAGLHACGDLSVTMLRTFLECEEVKAVVSIGCCYNLLSEEGFENHSSQCGFPMSCGINLAGLWLGKSARDLACQSADRWRVLSKDAAFNNFESHAFRSAFQMVLHRYYPYVLQRSPSIGRQGKTLRRQQVAKVIRNHLNVEESTSYPLASPRENCIMERSYSTQKFEEVGGAQELISDISLRDDKSCTTIGTDEPSVETPFSYGTRCTGIQFPDSYSLFKKYCDSGLRRLGLLPSATVDILGLWTESYPFSELVGPYWSVRAALGPVVETLLLLDRLLFLQERGGGSVEAELVPIFDPTLSPRNMAIIARKIDADSTS